MRQRPTTSGAVSRRAAISTFVWLLALSYLYVELSTGERAMGVFIVPLLVALQAIPAVSPASESANIRGVTTLAPRTGASISRRCPVTRTAPGIH